MKSFAPCLRPAVAALVMGFSLTFAVTDASAAASDSIDVNFINGWSVAGDKAIVVVHTLGHDYRAELQPGCFGLDLSIGVRFIPTGRFNNQFDRFGHVLLNDGTKCYLKSFVEIPRVKADRGRAQTPKASDPR